MAQFRFKTYHLGLSGGDLLTIFRAFAQRKKLFFRQFLSADLYGRAFPVLYGPVTRMLFAPEYFLSEMGI